MKKIGFSFLTLILACAPLFFASCDKIDKLTTVEVELGEVPFDIKLNLDADKTSARVKTANFVSFSGTSAPISLESAMFEKLDKYDIGSVVLLVTEVKVKITTTSESGTVVKDFTSSVTGAEIASYTKSGEIDLNFEYGDLALTKYMKDIFAAVQNNKTVTIAVSGQTDIVPSEIEGATIAVATIIPTLTAEVKLLK